MLSEINGQRRADDVGRLLLRSALIYDDGHLDGGSSCLHAHLLSQWSERGFFHVIVNVQNEKPSTYGAKSFSQQGCGGWVGCIPLWPSSVLVWLHSFGSGKQNMPAFWPFRVWSSPLKKFTPSISRRPLSLVTLSCITLLTGSHGGGAGEHCTRGGLVFWKRG